MRAGPTAGDGRLNAKEIRQVLNAGHNEVSKLPEGKGMKVAVASNDGDKTLVVEEEGDKKFPTGVGIERLSAVVIVQRPTVDLTAATLAHEIGHTLTLSHPENQALVPGDVATNK